MFLQFSCVNKLWTSWSLVTKQNKIYINVSDIEDILLINEITKLCGSDVASLQGTFMMILKILTSHTTFL
jgi:hypothetical protein